MVDTKVLPRDLPENNDPSPVAKTIVDDGVTVFSTTIEGLGESMGALQSLQAGPNITIDNTDPRNPVIIGSDSESMLTSVYDPQGISNDAFARENHTGTQPISATEGLQEALDGKLSEIPDGSVTFPKTDGSFGRPDFDTRAQAEAWGGSDPMPQTIVLRGRVAVDDGLGGTYVLDHISDDVINVAGSSYGRVEANFYDISRPDQHYRRRIIGQWSQRFSDYDAVLATYGYSYVYPQSFWIDEVANELWVAHFVSGGTNTWAWFTVFDFTTKAEKVTFSAGSGTPEGMAIVYEGGSRFLYSKHATNTMGKYNVTSLPANISRITAVATYDISFRQTFSYRNRRFYTETVTRGTGSFKHGISIFDENFSPKGILQLNPFVEGVTDNSPSVLNKRQGLSVGDGFIAGAYGGIYIEDGSGDPLGPETDIGVKVVSPNGTLLRQNLCDAQLFIDKLASIGITATRCESEGCFVTSDNRILMMTILLGSSTAGPGEGILITEEFSNHPDAVDFSDCAAPETPVMDPNYYRPLRMGFDPTSSMRNPLTGLTFTSLADIWGFMSYMNVGRFEFFTTSFPNITDWDGNTLPAAHFVEIINYNNLECDVTLTARSGSKRAIYWSGSAQTNRPTQANFACNKGGTNQTIPSASNTKVSFTNEVRDTGGHFDAPNSRLIPAMGQVFRINAVVTIASGVAAGAALYLYVFKNGAEFRRTMRRAVNNDGNESLSVSVLTDTGNDTDFYEIYVFADGAGNKVLAGSGGMTWVDGEAI